MKISVCIATHERSELLHSALMSLKDQTRPAEEIIISDSSATVHSLTVVESFKEALTECKVKHVRSTSRALPWQRWWASEHATGDLILFLDDDVRLGPTALELLERAYQDLSLGAEPVAGIGFMMTWMDGEQPTRDRYSLKERWVGTARWPSGAATPGGLGVSAADLRSDDPVPVEQLWGGAMSFKREVVQQVGLLDELVALYENGIGRAEDGVLSFCARRYGALYMITQPVAFHPREAKAPGVSMPYARNGWHEGLTGTWGRAHTMRWLASDQTACFRQWLRVASLEWGRSVFEIIKRPLNFGSWERWAGAFYGTTRTLLRWHTIAPAPYSEPGKVCQGGSEEALVSSCSVIPERLSHLREARNLK